MLQIPIDHKVAARCSGLGVVSKKSEVTVLSTHSAEAAVRRLTNTVTYTLSSSKHHPVVRAYRDFYWRIGIDPTKVRPASEALARRFISSGSLPRINNVVDAGNLASLETLVRIGLYDLGRVRGEMVLRFSQEGESLVDIAGLERRLGGNDFVLADDLGGDSPLSPPGLSSDHEHRGDIVGGGGLRRQRGRPNVGSRNCGSDDAADA